MQNPMSGLGGYLGSITEQIFAQGIPAYIDRESARDAAEELRANLRLQAATVENAMRGNPTTQNATIRVSGALNGLPSWATWAGLGIAAAVGVSLLTKKAS
ncbi:hypothetical protein JYT97_00020 [Haliea sp. AH-315-K21]|uniref:Uncharacterized protein n=1 Tax=SAR86 cluster bacterium TaxID=2030880 RepID=A0A2A5CF47_9GAMM|nr:hypothetical protein [Haliea sp. AH-315-K21]PCJ42090.1 MAG: hypothetical protein COA71_05725 [SAR86 cluster bacterium]